MVVYSSSPLLILSFKLFEEEDPLSSLTLPSVHCLFLSADFHPAGRYHPEINLSPANILKSALWSWKKWWALYLLTAEKGDLHLTEEYCSYMNLSGRMVERTENRQTQMAVKTTTSRD